MVFLKNNFVNILYEIKMTKTVMNMDKIISNNERVKSCVFILFYLLVSTMFQYETLLKLGGNLPMV